jgi:hypothetical protein
MVICHFAPPTTPTFASDLAAASSYANVSPTEYVLGHRTVGLPRTPERRPHGLYTLRITRHRGTKSNKPAGAPRCSFGNTSGKTQSRSLRCLHLELALRCASRAILPGDTQRPTLLRLAYLIARQSSAISEGLHWRNTGRGDIENLGMRAHQDDWNLRSSILDHAR